MDSPNKPPPLDRSSSSLRKRPSTAPASEMKLPFLPAARQSSSGSSISLGSLSGNAPGSSGSGRSGSSAWSNVDKTFSEAFTSSDAATDHSSINAPSSSLSPPLSLSLSDPEAPSASIDNVAEDSGYDWNVFISAYAAGQWDPARIPFPPNPTITPSAVLGTSQSENSSPQNDLLTRPGLFRRAMTSSSSGGTITLNSKTWTRTNSDMSTHIISASSNQSDNPSSPVQESASESSLSQRRNQKLQLPADLISRGTRRDSIVSEPQSSPATSPFGLSSLPPVSSLNPAAVTTAATLRWASSNVSVRPLALPSPERELVDPMVSALHTPGATAKPPSPEGSTKSSQPASALRRFGDLMGSPKYERSASSPKLGTIPSSPEDQQGESGRGSNTTSPDPSVSKKSAVVSPRSKLPPATAPYLTTTMPASDGDYFSPIIRTSMAPSVKPSTTMPSSTFGPPSSSNTGLSNKSRPVMKKSSESVRSVSPTSHQQSRLELNRQTSEPLNVGNLDLLPPAQSSQITSGDPATSSESSNSPHFPSRARPSEQLKHPQQEDFYCDKGWLTAPLPQDEPERLRALYKYNILYTHKDVNFDRITHLAKLVFQSKSVAISLIDDRHQWFKSEAGWNLDFTTRRDSLCSHAILQRSDEPVVILDTYKDWRFAQNPLVRDGPQIRFYAGAPLRTHEGLNIGTLCLLDDRPRSEFTPRNRHALKEFASIIMREMELWRDKIQLKMRDRIQISMEQFTRECLQVDTATEEKPNAYTSASSPTIRHGAMDQIYQRATHLVKDTLDVEGACVIDVSRSGLHESSQESEGQISVILYGTFEAAPAVNSHGHFLSTEDYEQLVEFFSKYPDGIVTESRLPTWFIQILPPDILHALIVPIFNIDQRPFALLVAYNTVTVSKNFLDGHELSYLRAVGVIILSAVLKRRMILADKAKSLFISNISHELRTPLHGILAAAELLAESSLNHHQQAFLQTVQACGASLVETVNHVLDYTKLSGNVRAGGLENVIPPSEVDLMQLVEDVVEGCWVGYKARSPNDPMEIGTVYAPPTSRIHNPVETVVDVELRIEGWRLYCEKGGIRRVLTNLIGNSLKFTSSGYIQVALRSAQPLPTTSENAIRVELSVNDTGKGISGDFLRTQLFEPFSQENPLQTGTGLGLAIVKSIVESKGINGSLDVSSVEGAGTEMRISFDAEVVSSYKQEDRLGLDQTGRPITVGLISFDTSHRGGVMLLETVSTYLTAWWGFQRHLGFTDDCDILLIDENPSLLAELQSKHDFSRPVVILSSVRGDATFMNALGNYERSGGFCRVMFKPGGPSRLRHIMSMCVNMVKIRRAPHYQSSITPSLSNTSSASNIPSLKPSISADEYTGPPILSRRRSEETPPKRPVRPSMGQRSSTYHPHAENWSASNPGSVGSTTSSSYSVPNSPGLTVNVGSGATLLKSSINTLIASKGPRVLIVEDNTLLRSLLAKWLASKGYEYAEAHDGQQGVDMFKTSGPFDIILIDLSMPVLDGISATAEIRQLESSIVMRNKGLRKSGHSISDPSPARILALTGMSSLDDKRRAFEAGVDGYLVKPVAFKTLTALFQQLGLS